MSATFKIAKKKYTQNDLRRLMHEQKLKTKPATTAQQKIDSPLAKYNDIGQLTCVLCKSVVRSESVWKVHVNTKQHKENIEAAKQLKERLQNASNGGFKRPSTTMIKHQVPEKKLKSILINSTARKSPATGEIKTELDESKSTIPSDFFDSNTSNNYFEITLGKTSIKTDLINIKRGFPNGKHYQNDIATSNNANRMDVDDCKDEKLPEGFFDDPIRDAKVRNLEYKDPQEEEWDKFQREIKEQSTVSSAIIAVEQEEATVERQIEEIDEQIRKWSKVLDLEKKKEAVKTKLKDRVETKMEEDIGDSSDDSDDEDFDEFLDWRAKNLFH